MWPFSRNDATGVPAVRSVTGKSLVQRLDMFLLTFGCISQVIKYLDQTNIQNAYVSGMKEELQLFGLELNYFTTYFNIGYCIMLIPSQIILTHVRPSYWLPGLEITWGVLTGLLAIVTSANQVYAIRVFLGLCESSAWPGMMTLLMHWYTPMELAKRMGFFHSCQALGGLFSGALQASVSTTLRGAYGMSGWRWLFIVNGVMTVVVGAIGLVMLPDYPNDPNPRAVWFTKQHAELSLERLARHGRGKPSPVTWAGVKRTLRSWITVIIPFLYCCTVIGNYGVQYFELFLKSRPNADGSQRWTTAEVNAIPMGGRAIQIAFVWIWAIISDCMQIRWQLIVAQCTLALVPTLMMSIWSALPSQMSDTTAYAGFFLNFIVLGTAPLLFSWLADIIPQDPEVRALVVGVAIAADYAVQAWSNSLMWPATEAPYYRVGWKVSAVLMLLAATMVFVLHVADAKYFRYV
ncbi:major facilitator superfamily domain-containing protein [Microdochium trichocladiopsis]|uniref:Major facilitator superfamily domain-containing protein n=1 Tax=Microdochium trichocladiopsis TaxID=1682393 RepID=A0A9P8XSF6_9PEZI|nr:major facilitator superfamily domain-containing protein [Microdochium trichocladiopsis]KAH7014411.1 major facilitator superfamily domain-containing protein [Microdochium trichocladiopsis]